MKNLRAGWKNVQKQLSQPALLIPKTCFFVRTVPASTKNAINLNKLATLVGENDEDLDLDLLAKKLKEFDDDITETHMKRVNSLKNRCVINMTTCGMERSQSLKGEFILTIFNFGQITVCGRFVPSIEKIEKAM